MTSGWHKESRRHSLAAQGIQTTSSGSIMTVKINAAPAHQEFKQNKELQCKDYDGNLIERKPLSSAVDIGTEEYKDKVTALIAKHNKGPVGYEMSDSVIVFPTFEAAHLWIDEYLGQISDGKYENSRGSRFETWGKMRVAVVPGATPHIEGSRPNSINFAFNDLIWLFNAEEPERKRVDGKKYEDWPVDNFAVRNVFSKVPTAKIKEFNKQITTAVNKKKGEF